MRARALFLALVAACSVDRSALDEEIFPCRGASDCLDGYGCQLDDASGNGFCAPEVEEGGRCDGFRTAGGLCIAECNPGGAGCDGDLSCVSIDIIGGDGGYCAPLDTCSSDAECPGDQACLSTVVAEFVDALWGPMQFPDPSDLSCVVRCDEDGECPTGTECLGTLLQGLEYCVPRCGDDSACPLGFACYSTTAGTSIGLCLPGLPGLTCRDDASCLAGPCQTFGEEPDTIDLCVAPCDGGGAAPACTDASMVDGRLNVFQCTEVAGGDEYCVFKGGYLHQCALENLNADCVDGLECALVPDGQGGQAPACIRDCTYDPGSPNLDANGDCSDNAFCYPGTLVDPPFIDTCVFDLPNDVPCLFDDQCESGACRLEVSCGEQPELGCCGPAS